MMIMSRTMGVWGNMIRLLSDNVFVLMTVVTVVNLMALIMSKSIPVRTRSNASLSYTVIPPDSKYWL